jgi:hypothetical protein
MFPNKQDYLYLVSRNRPNWAKPFEKLPFSIDIDGVINSHVPAQKLTSQQISQQREKSHDLHNALSLLNYRHTRVDRMKYMREFLQTGYNQPDRARFYRRWLWANVRDNAQSARSTIDELKAGRGRLDMQTLIKQIKGEKNYSPFEDTPEYHEKFA